MKHRTVTTIQIAERQNLNGCDGLGAP